MSIATVTLAICEPPNIHSRSLGCSTSPTSLYHSPNALGRLVSQTVGNTVKKSSNPILRQKERYRDTKLCPCIFGGEGEIRTLEPCYRLHDFQSCALDQLGDFSKVILYLLCKYITSFFKNQGFFEIYQKVKILLTFE